MTDTNDVLMNTDQHGFVFKVEAVSDGRGNDKQEIGSGPILVITDPITFEGHFPGRIAAMLDGTSARVISQRVVRDAWKSYRKAMQDERGAKPSEDELKPRVLRAVLGVRQRTTATRTVEVQVYVLQDGSTTQDKDKFLDNWGIEG